MGTETQGARGNTKYREKKSDITPPSMADQGTPWAMADQGTWAAMED